MLSAPVVVPIVLELSSSEPQAARKAAAAAEPPLNSMNLRRETGSFSFSFIVCLLAGLRFRRFPTAGGEEADQYGSELIRSALGRVGIRPGRLRGDAPERRRSGLRPRRPGRPEPGRRRGAGCSA